MSAAVEIAAGGKHSCARLSNGTVNCWGLNGYGQLGNGSTTTFFSAPVVVSGISTATAIAAGGNHTCAVLSNGAVNCWGDNTYGQLGNGTSGGISRTPVVVSGISTATAVTVGGSHSCARLSDSTVRCWGKNNSAQLGNGTTTNSSTPVAVSGINTAAVIAAGGSHSCAVLSDGTVRCWGESSLGQLGNGGSPSITPVAVSGISTATAVAAGGSHNCARLSGSTLNCWGLNSSGQIGNGTTNNALTPAVVSGINTASAIAAGGNHSCAALSNGTVNCWGDNSSGQLGNGTTGGTSLTPVVVSGLNVGSSNPTLTLTKSGTGAGTVTSSPAGINCGATCSASFTSGTSVTLTATASTGSVFAGFSGGCTSATTTCTFTITSNATVTATFNSTDSQAPTAPANLTAMAAGTNQVNLSWTLSTDNVGVSGYWIERCQGAGCSNFARINTSLVTTTNYSDTGLTADTFYTYRIQAADAAGNLSGYSNTAFISVTSTGYTLSSTSFGYSSYAVEGMSPPNIENYFPVPIPFSFSFFNTSYLSLSIGTDGFISFLSNVPANGCCNAEPLPNAGTPNAIIAAYWGNLMLIPGAGQIQYGTAGTAPNRIFIVEFINFHDSSSGSPINFQVKLFEGSNAVEIHCASCLSGGATHTQGIESQTGAIAAFVPGRNFSPFSLTNDAVRFADTISPTVPSNLAATAVNSGQINLSWTASTDNMGVSGYYVERCKGAGCTTFTQIATPTGTSYSDTGLEARTAYRYRVRAVDVGGNLGAYSNIVSVSTSPSEYTISSVSFGYSSYTVEGVIPPLTYDVSPPVLIPFSFSFFNVSYSSLSIGRNGFLTFHSASVPNSGCCGVQALPTAGIPEAVIAAHWWGYFGPAGGGLIQYGTTGTAPNRIFIVEYINIFDPTSPTPVNLQVKLFEGSNTIEIHCTSCLSGAAAHTQGIENETGTTAVFAPGRNLSSVSLINDAIRFTPLATGAPIAPSSLSAADHPADQGKVIDLAWTPSTSSGITQQRIYRSTPTAPYVLVTTINNNTTSSYTDTNLSNGVTYHYVVRAFNGTLESGNSNEPGVAPIDNIAPNAPTGLTAIDRPADEGGVINLSWTVSTSTDVTQQSIYRATSSGGPYTLIDTLLGNTTNTYSDASSGGTPPFVTGLTNGTTYYYVVRAFDGTQESVNSNQPSAVPVDNIAPNAQTNLVAKDHPADQGGAIDLSWTVSTSLDVVEQRVYRATGRGGPYTLINTISGNTTSSYTDPGATPNVTYHYIVRAYDGTQEGANSAEASGASVNNILASYVYDEATSTNGKGKLTTVHDPSGSTKFFYDNMGRVKQTDKTVDGTLFSTSTAFDLAGRTKSVTYPDGEVVHYLYDGPVLSKVSKDANGAVNYATYTGHNALGQVATVTFGNGVTTTYTHSNAANGTCPKDNFRLCNITTRLGTTKYQDLTYSYDNNGLGVGNITGITDAILTDTSPPPGIKHTNQTQTFGYNDSLNRLTSANGPYGSITYAYDKLGNMTCNSSISSCTASSPNYTYGDLAHRHAVTHVGPLPGGIDYSYNANGNMVGRGSDILTYDVQGRLTTATNAGGTTTFVYDGDGGRVKKMNGSVTNIYIGKFWECTLSASATSCKSGSAWTSANVKHIFAGSARIAIKPVTTTNEIKYFHADHLGTTSVVTDQTGERSAEYVYRPYGDELLAAGGDFRYKYTGQEEDGETGLYFYNARYYDPALARFIQPDSIVPSPGNTQSLNRYSYVRNNPVLLNDPSGQCEFVCLFLVGAAIGGFSAGVQSDWNMEAVLMGATMGGVSAAVGGTLFTGVSESIYASFGYQTFYTGTLVSVPAYVAPTTAGQIVGNTIAGIFSGAYVGGITAAGYNLAGYEVNGVEAMARGAATQGAIGFLSGTALATRSAMIKSSLIDSRNASGQSVGVNGDGFKLAGCRWPCKDSYLGDIQGQQGKIFGFEYSPDSLVDHVIEHFAGPHDFLNAPIWYDSFGNTANLSFLGRMFGEFMNYTVNLAAAMPFGVSSLIQPYSFSLTTATTMASQKQEEPTGQFFMPYGQAVGP